MNQSRPQDPMDAGSVNPDEVAKFARMAEAWWDTRGEARPLHRINPLRVGYIRDQICRQKGLSTLSRRPLAGVRILDVGCGGGLICEALARLGADVTGIDVTADNIRVARTHAEAMGLNITYRHVAAEVLAEEGASFDAVVCMEVVEHVADIAGFTQALGRLVADNGLMLVSTLNRTGRSFALGIIAAEYVLGWVPRGTHDWKAFVTPEEFAGYLSAAGFTMTDTTGLSYQPIGDRFVLSSDTSVNYLGTARRSA